MGRYRLMQRVHEHAGGALWQASELVDGVARSVALRTFAPEPTLRARLRRTIALGHANVVEVKELGEADGRLYVVRQWVAGCDVERLLEGVGRVSLRQLLLVAIDVLRGLEHAANVVDANGQPAGLAHGRVTSRNVLVSFEGEVKLTDFGLAVGSDGWAEDAAAVAQLLARAPSPPQGLSAIVGRARQPGGYGAPSAMREDLEGFARREGQLLSPAELGQLTRDVVARSSAPKGIQVPVPVRAPLVRPFDQALGLGLAALADPLDDEVAATTPAPRTVALQPIIAAPAESPRPDRAEPQRPARPARRWPLALLGGASFWLFVGIGLWARQHHPPVESLLIPSPSSLPLVAPAPPAAPARVGKPAPAPAPREEKVRPLRPAHLSLTSDVACDALIDGRYIGETPLLGIELAPGPHIVRLESTMAGLRLIPKEQTVDLIAGQSKNLHMELQ